MKEKLKVLFDEWKKEHAKEIIEIRKQIDDEKVEECDGRIFQEKLYNQHTISSHFIQFFYRDKCKECVEMQEDKVWEFVLKKAFNEDGYVGDYAIPQEGYRYIALLKEANDSDKSCVKMNYENHVLPNQWLKDWKEDENKGDKGKNKGNYKMLRKLNNAFNIFLKDIENEKQPVDFFFKKMAYMNVNKRGGTSATLGRDQDVLINYATRYKEFILKEIDILSLENKEVTVFVCGKRDNYFEKLGKALCGENIEIRNNMFKYDKFESSYGDKRVKFINITHPSGRIKADDLAKEMKQGEENENLPNR